MDKPSVDGPVFMLSAKCLMLSPDSLREQMAAAMMYQTELLITEVRRTSSEVPTKMLVAVDEGRVQHGCKVITAAPDGAGSEADRVAEGDTDLKCLLVCL
ncbi:hypothetical protein GN244_ATG16315 [Phytophthora infestans]|uniref:Uncharacterized protein n=1 Tax=Phytophthora infestans TaxID=4787 RepID=A0A833S3J9_PHYIN|nr:hypothetical protein GN244_ATG16315 [Phytophthora infestans]